MKYIKYTSHTSFRRAEQRLGRYPQCFFSFERDYQVFEITDEEAQQLSVFTGRRKFQFLKKGLPPGFHPCWKVS